MEDTSPFVRWTSGGTTSSRPITDYSAYLSADCLAWA